MKRRIALKLIIYFASALLLFALVIGGVFLTLFRKYTLRINRTNLETRAVSMASTLSEYLQGGGTSGNGMGSGMMGGYRAYIRFVGDIAMADVWIVDENLEVLVNTPGTGSTIHYADLPPDAEFLVEEVFRGKTAFSEGFSELLQTPAVTVGTPITDGTQVIGALLLHAPVSGISEGVLEGLRILLVSIAAALVIAIILSVALALAFTGPLKKMKNTALRLASGDYSAKTGVVLQDEIGELASSIDILSDRLGEASTESARLQKLREDFITNISHELRTPVTVLRGSVEALADGVVRDPEQVKEYYAQMLSESIFLQRLVNDLLDLSRLQNADFPIDGQDISLCEVLRESVRSSRQMAKAKNITIQSDIEESSDPSACVMHGDYGRIRQMLMIVLDNAIKFSPENSSISVTFKNRTISVEDHGQGIREEDLPYIFDRFYRSGTSRAAEGTGLGLAIARSIAERHGITLEAASVYGSGSTFTFRFPI